MVTLNSLVKCIIHLLRDVPFNYIYRKKVPLSTRNISIYFITNEFIHGITKKN
jgi:hypothetical protein